LPRYRYRTQALVGPWRESLEDAAKDAARAGQLVFEGSDSAMRWMVAGEIEEALDRPPPKIRTL
jgi:hypothetical protein